MVLGSARVERSDRSIRRRSLGNDIGRLQPISPKRHETEIIDLRKEARALHFLPVHSPALQLQTDITTVVPGHRARSNHSSYVKLTYREDRVPRTRKSCSIPWQSTMLPAECYGILCPVERCMRGGNISFADIAGEIL